MVFRKRRKTLQRHKMATICDDCRSRKSTHRHHAVITRKQYMKVRHPLALAVVEAERNILNLCADCHGWKYGGHISRPRSIELVNRKHGAGTAQKLIDEFNKYVKVKIHLPQGCHV